MVGYLLKGLMIGIVCGVPIGAAGAMTTQRTLRYGVKQGLITGLGSSVADAIFAVIGVFGLTVVSEFLTLHTSIINIAGGIIVLVMGLSMFRQKQTEYKHGGSLKNFVTTFTVGITNPVAIAAFMIAFSYIGIQGKCSLPNGSMAVLGVFIGTYIWWAALTYVVYLAKKRSRCDIISKVNIALSFLLVVLGAIMIIKGVFELLLIKYRP